MEERVPPPPNSGDHHHNNNHHEDEEFDQQTYLRNRNNNNNNHHLDDHEMSMQIVSSSTDKPHETYIIQIPKDQIYRVPPPENAEIVERFRNPAPGKNPRSRCLFWFLSIFFLAAFLVSVIFCVHHFTLSPKPPTFAIKHVVVTHPAKKPPGLKVTVHTANPNVVNDLGFDEGTASILYKGKVVAKGSFPALDEEESGKSNEVDVVLAGSSSKGVGLDLSNSKKNNKPVTLDMSMSIPVKMKTWLWKKDVDVNVKCEFEVNSLGDNVKLLLQKCDVQL